MLKIASDHRVEQHLEIDDNRMRPTGNQVSGMTVRSAQDIKQAKQHPGSPVVQGRLVRVLAGQMFDKLHPTVRGAFQNLEHLESRRYRLVVEPGQQPVIGGFESDIAWFVD